MEERGRSPSNFDLRCLKLSANILRLANQLPKTAANRIVVDQLLRSSTSVGANVHEARGAESRGDFIHKFHLAFKEARETEYWLGLIKEAGLTSDASLPHLAQEAAEIAAILAKSIVTAKRNGRS